MDTVFASDKEAIVRMARDFYALLDAVPPCSCEGKGACVLHALEWIQHVQERWHIKRGSCGMAFHSTDCQCDGFGGER